VKVWIYKGDVLPKKARGKNDGNKDGNKSES